MSTEVTEREARAVAEAGRAREWKLPSFGKELFLGSFRLELIRPQPRLDAGAVDTGEAFLEAGRVPRGRGRLRSEHPERADAAAELADPAGDGPAVGAG